MCTLKIYNYGNMITSNWSFVIYCMIENTEYIHRNRTTPRAVRISKFIHDQIHRLAKIFIYINCNANNIMAMQQHT